MASASMNRLLDDVRIRAPGAIDSTIYAEVLTAADALLRKSGAWKQEFEFDVTPSTSSPLTSPDDFTYKLNPPAGSMCVRLIGVVNANGTPTKATMPVTNYIQLAGSPNGEETYRALLVLTVSDPVTRAGEPVFPDWIVQKYRDALMDGILAGLMGQQAKPYTNISLAAFHKSSFKSKCAAARIDVDRGNVQGGQAWRFPQSFNVRKPGRGF